jgi:hypothetical protein
MANAAIGAESPPADADKPAVLTPIVDTRLRYETIDQDGFASDAEALTVRARLGFETRQVWHTSLLAEGEFVAALEDRYNSTTNGESAYPVVADPESHELNRLQLTNTSLPATSLILGRQRIVLDDHRFVGNVGWRQNEQTYDSFRVLNRSFTDTTIDLAYVRQVNRVFGKESPQGRYESDSILANISYQAAIGKVTVFGYQLEFDPIAGVPAAAQDSSLTFGARIAGEKPVRAVKLGYLLSYASQQDAGANPLSFDLHYALAELTASYRAFNVGAGFERLDGDGNKGFTTPLATLHMFQGWADKFLTTPVDGIEDRYVKAGFAVQKPGVLDSLSAIASYHWFEAERHSREYGSELNLQLQARWHRIGAALKYADYRADGFATDTSKLWVQLEYIW